MGASILLFASALLFWAVIGLFTLALVRIADRFDHGRLVDRALGGDPELEHNREEHYAQVRAIGGGRRHLRVVEAIGDDVDRDVFPPTGDAA